MTKTQQYKQLSSNIPCLKVFQRYKNQKQKMETGMKKIAQKNERQKTEVNA